MAEVLALLLIVSCSRPRVRYFREMTAWTFANESFSRHTVYQCNRVFVATRKPSESMARCDHAKGKHDVTLERVAIAASPIRLLIDNSGGAKLAGDDREGRQKWTHVSRLAEQAIIPNGDCRPRNTARCRTPVTEAAD
jgi:hypothetical protein